MNSHPTTSGAGIPPAITAVGTATSLLRTALAGLCLLAASVVRAEITLAVQPNRTQIYLGETVNLNVTVNGTDDEQAVPDLSALQGDVQLLGSRSESRTFQSNINGHVTRTDTRSRRFDFQVQPRAAGTFATGPVTVTFKRQRYEGRGPDVQVVGQEQQDSVVSKISASREAVLVDEPFTITLSVSVAGLPPPNEKYEPIHPSSPPHLACSYLNLADIQGLQTPNMQQVLQGLISNDPRTPAFTLNDFQTQGLDLFNNPFGNFDPRPHPIRFRLTPTTITRDKRTYWEYTLPLVYTPKQEGDYTFGPLEFKGSIITGADARGQALQREIFCVGPAVTVRVIPPPEANRPECFIGSVGSNLAAHAELDASICKVGDPLTLTLDVTGAVSLSNMRPPVLNLQSDLSADFRIYDDNVETMAIPSGKRFRYRVRPIREGTLEFPSILVAWFDTRSRAYKTVRSQPIPVQARANTQIVSDSTNQASHITRLTVERTTTTPSAITVVAAGACPERLLPPPRTLLLLLAAGPLGWLLVWSGLLLHRHRARLSAAHRRRRALSLALTALRKAGRASHPDAAAIGHAMRSFLAARLAVTGSALTAGEVEALLQTNGVSHASAAACGALLARLDQALYRPDTAEAEPAAVIRDAISLLPQIAADLDRPPERKEDAP